MPEENNHAKDAERKLVEQKELLTAIYLNAPLVMMVVNAERRIQQVNGFATRLAARDAEEMLGLRGGEALRCMHVLDDPRGCGFGDFCQQCVIRNTVLDTLKTGKTYLQVEAPFFYKGKDNRIKEMTLLASTTPIMIQGERMVLVTLQDITERKQAEEALRESRKKLRASLDATPFPIAVVDLLDDTIFFWSRSALELFGHTAQTTSEWYQMAYPDPDYRQDVIERWKASLDKARHSGQTVNTGEYRVTCKDGSERICELYATFLTDNLMVTFNDITERKRADELLKSNFALLQIASKTARFGGWIVNLEKSICTWSDAVADIHEVPHGYAPSIEEGINFYAPEWRKKIAQVFSDCAHKGIPYDEEMEIITSKGKRIWVKTSGRAVKDENDKIIKVQGSLQDITEQKQLEEELKQNETFTRTILDNLPIGIAVNSVDPEVTFSYMNDKFPEIYRTTREALETPGSFWNVVYEDPQFRTGLRQRVMDDCASGDPQRMRWTDIPVTRQGKETSYISAQNIPVPNQPLMISTVIDVTEPKRAEEALREKSNLLERIFDNNFDLISLTDLEGNFTVVGKSHEILGYDTEFFIGKNVMEFVHPEDVQYVKKKFNEFIQSGEKSTVEYRYKRINGEYLWFETIGKVLKSKNGKPEQILFNTRNITERKRAETQLKESESRFKALHNASFGGIAIHDKGLILECNQGLSEMTGYSLDELIGMDGLLLIAPETRDMVMDNILSGNEKPYEAVGLRKNGELFPIRLEARNVPYKGKTVRTVEFRDITESKQAQEALHRIEWMLSKESAGLKSDYAQPYGDLSQLNRDGLILDSLGNNVLKNIANDFLRLLESSSAVYEKNGDYALGLFASGWCRFMDQASWELCGTNDTKEAMTCGKWLCHDSCWKEASQPAIASGRPVDIECQGGIRLYALPIVAGGEVIGAINFGYGDPPRDIEKLSELAEKYKVPLDELKKKAKEYQSRPSFIIETAKDRLKASAHLIGEIVSRKITEKEILTLNKQLEQKVAEKTRELRERIDELERFHEATIEREFRVKELRDEIERLKNRDKE